jgi:hypothetical protein
MGSPSDAPFADSFLAYHNVVAQSLIHSSTVNPGERDAVPRLTWLGLKLGKMHSIVLLRLGVSFPRTKAKIEPAFYTPPARGS